MSSHISDAELLRYAREVQIEILEDLGRHDEVAALEPLDDAVDPEATITHPNEIDRVQRTAKPWLFRFVAKRARNSH